MKRYHLLLIAFCITIISCKKESEQYDTAMLNEYYPLEVGKYITYQLDSLVYLPFGTSSVIRSYQVKYYTDAQITDNLQRPAYRIIRFIRTLSTDPWTADATFMAVNTGTSIEFTENNLRYIKLKLPVRNGTTWKGNSFIDTESFNSNLIYLDDWDYTYDSVGAPVTVGSFALDTTLKVDQRDEVIGNPDDPFSYSEINYGMEKYASGIGMVYRKFFHSEYQPGGSGFFADGSYGVTYTMIDHN